MYNNLINSLKKILESKSTQAEKLLKISTLVDFAGGLERPTQPTQHFGQQMVPQPDPYKPEQKPNTPLQVSKPAAGPGAIVGVEDVK